MLRRGKATVVHSNDQLRNDEKVQQAMKVLEDVIGRTYEDYTVEWDKAADGNGKYRLRLSDRRGEVRAEFTRRNCRISRGCTGDSSVCGATSCRSVRTSNSTI